MFGKCWKGKKGRRLTACLLACTMVLSAAGVFPLTVSADEGNMPVTETVTGNDITQPQSGGVDTVPCTYVLSADDLTAGDITEQKLVGKDAATSDTNERFTINATNSAKWTVDTGKKTFMIDGQEVAITNRLKSNGVADGSDRNIAFTVPAGLTADVTVCAISSNSSSGAEIALYANGSITDKVLALAGSSNYSKDAAVWENIGSGNFYIANTGNGAKSANFFYVRVAEKKPGETIAAPTAVSISAQEDTAQAGQAKVSIIGTPGGQGSKYIVQASKTLADEASWIKIAEEDGTKDAATVNVDLTALGSGEWYFRVYGTGTGVSDTAAQTTTTPIVYTLAFGTPSIKAAAPGDKQVTVEWSSVEEAEKYRIDVYTGAGDTTPAASVEITDPSKTSGTVTDLTNGAKYWASVSAMRGAEVTTSERVSFFPYAPIDTSAAVPGMQIVDQESDIALTVLRENGNMSLVQPATSGGVASTSRTNISFVQWKEAVTGDFTLSADLTMTSTAGGTGRGVFLGAMNDMGKDAHWMSVGLRGDMSARAYFDQINNGSGTAKTMVNFDLNKTYNLSVERTGETYTVTVDDGTAPVSKSYKKSDAVVEEALWGAMYPAIAFCGVEAQMSHLKLVVNGETKIDSDTWTGSFVPFADNWQAADAPVLKTPVVDNAAQTITVECEGLVGIIGAGQIVVEMLDASGKAVDSKTVGTFGEASRTLTFEPTASGDYTFVATASRAGENTVKTSNTVTVSGFVLKLAGTTVSASNQGGGAVKVNWSQVKEATGYHVYYKTADSAYVLGAENVAGLTATISGLTNGVTYTFKVVAVRGREVSTEEATVDKTVRDVFEPDWFFSAFGGSSISLEKNGYEGNANDGAVRVWTTGSGGKLVPASVDQVAFYYTEIPADKNFTLTATAKVNNWTYTNGQEGFGLMAADAVAENGSKDNFWNNSYMAYASKVEYYWDDAKQEVSDAGVKISMKMGLGSQEKVGVTPENLAELNGANQTEAMAKYFKASVKPLESSCGAKGTGTYNLIANDSNATGTVENPLTEVTFTIQKNNTGYFVSYTDADGNVTMNKYYDPKALEHLDADTVYAGVFTARSCDVTFTDVQVTLIDPEDDLPAEERPVTSVTPSYNVISASHANSSRYDLVFLANADGVLNIRKEDGTVIAENQAVSSRVKVTVPASLTKGTTRFQITFTPDADYKPSEYEVLSSYETVTFEHSVTYQIYEQGGKVIYVSPDGKNSGNGTKENPLDIYTAVKYAQAGQYIVLRGGSYLLKDAVKVERGVDGTAENMIYMLADPEDEQRPVFDFGQTGTGMIFAGDYWYCQGFDVTNSANGQKGLQISGSYSTFDDIHAYHNGNTGIQVSRYLSSDAWEDWPSHDLILNCTSYGNADAGYEDADGFAAKLTIGDGIVFDGCIAYNNADDGWDLFAKPETGPIGQVTIRNCVAYGNGYLEDGTNAGNGNGFKMGGSAITGYHRLINSISFANKAKGIDSNSCPDIQVERSTTFNNGSYNVAFYTSGAASTDFGANGVLSYRTENLSMAEQIKPQGTQDINKIYGVSNYYWDAGKELSVNTEGASVGEDWFQSLTLTSIARNTDGTVNMNGFLALTSAAPDGVGAVMAGTPSRVIQLPAADSSVYDDDDSDNNGSNDSNGNNNSSDTGSETTAPTPAPAATTAPKGTKPGKKPATTSKTAGETVKKLVIDEELDWQEVDELLEELQKEAATGSDVLEVTLGKYYDLPVEIVQGIKDRNILLRITQSNGVIWEINGKEIEEPAAVSMKVTLNSSGVPAEALECFRDFDTTIQLSLDHSGVFGFKATMRFPTGGGYNGKYANLFWYHDGAFEWIGSSKVADGYAEFMFDHASDYVVVIADVEVTDVPQADANTEADGVGTEDTAVNAETVENAGTTGEIWTTLLIILVVLAAGVCAIVVVAMRRKKEQ